MISLLITLSPVLLVIFLIIYRINKKDKIVNTDENQVKRFFQYLTLFGLVIIVGSGLSGLISRLLSESDFIISDQATLARNISFILVGLPLLLAVLLWLRKQHLAKASEQESFAWAFYLTAILTTSLLVSATAANSVLRWIFQIDDYSSTALAQLFIWGIIWAVHFFISKRFASAIRMQTQYLIGSFIGLLLAIIGLAGLISAALESVIFSSRSYIVGESREELFSSVINLILAFIIWTIYWIKTAAKSEKSALLNVYLLIVVVGGSLIAAVSTLSTGLYQILVWFIGTPVEKTVTAHFQNTPTLFAVVVVGILAWWYHRNFLSLSFSKARGEVERTYNYLLAGIGLVAATAGITAVLVAAIESLLNPTLVPANNAINTLLAAITFLLVGGPVWFINWNRVQKTVNQGDIAEITSQVRKIYLFLLFAIGAIAAVISLITAVFLILEDILVSDVSTESLRQMRFALSILLSSSLVSTYHWLLFKNERNKLGKTQLGPKTIFVISPPDKDLASWLKENTKAKFKIWFEEENNEIFSREELKDLLVNSKSDTVFVIKESGRLKLVKVAD